MRKTVTTLFMSLDGVIEADDDWQFVYFEDEWFGELTAGWDKASSVLLGRKSFEGYAALRTEHPESPVLAFLDGIPKHVVSATLRDPGWAQTTVIHPDHLHEQVGRLKAGSGGDVLV